MSRVLAVFVDCLLEFAHTLRAYRLPMLAAVMLTATTASALTLWPGVRNSANYEKGASIATVHEGRPAFMPVRSSQALALYAPATKASQKREQALRTRLSAMELPSRLQYELKRIGCYNGPINGRWSQRTRRALRHVLKKANARLSTREPQAAHLALLEHTATDTCGTETHRIRTAAARREDNSSASYAVPPSTTVTAAAAATSAREATESSSFDAQRVTAGRTKADKLTAKKKKRASKKKKRAKRYTNKRKRKYRRRGKKNAFARQMRRNMRKIKRAFRGIF